MTAQGGDILAWLDAAISDRTEKAEAALAFGDGFVGAADCVYGTGDGGPYLRVAVPGFDGQTEAVTRHFAEYGPKSVLRRCAADRRLIAEHGPLSERNPGCKGCGLDNHEELITDYYPNCPVLVALAEGYGWTGGER